MNSLDNFLELAKGEIQDDKPLAFDFPTFEFKNFYGLAGELADIATAESEADPVAVYVSFLVTTSAMLGRHKYLQIGESRHYARLFAALVGASSRARKGTSFKPVERVIRKTEEIYNTRHPSDIKTLAILGGLSSGEGLVNAVRDESEELKKDDSPLWLGVDDKRLLVVEEEFGNVLTVCKREGNTLSMMLRRAWDGGDLSPMTKNNRITATNPHINILAHITQFELKCLMSQSDIHNGLSNRFLWACVRRSKKMAFPKPMPAPQVEAMAESLVDALRHAETGESEMKLSPEAYHYWNVKYHDVSQDAHGIIGAITSRSEAYAIRLSLLFALLDCSNAVEKKHIEAAINLIEFCNESVKFTFTTPAEFDAGTDAEKLLSALAVSPLSQSEISRLFGGHKDRKELATLLNELQSIGRIESEKQAGSKKVVWKLTSKK